MTRPTSISSRMASALAAWVGFLILCAAHFGVRPFVRGTMAVDFAVIAVLFTSVRLRPGMASLTGFLVGLALDALGPSHFGAHALAYTLVAYGASWLKAAFFTDNPGLTGLFIFLGKWVVDLVLALLIGTGATGFWRSVFVWSPTSAAITAVVALVLLTVFRPLYRPSTA